MVTTVHVSEQFSVPYNCIQASYVAMIGGIFSNQFHMLYPCNFVMCASVGGPNFTVTTKKAINPL